GLDVEAADSFGRTALHHASDNGHLEVVTLLLEKGADLEAADIYGKTALHHASRNGHLEVVTLLLEKGADVKARDKIYGQTPLL
ncbi:ankyrin repeat-containing domain protein, partial [Bisporella sp. PMI_857]